MVEMMRTEQRIRAEKISLSSDKKNLEKLKQSGFCQNCSTLRRATSASNLRYDKDIIQSDGDWAPPLSGGDWAPPPLPFSQAGTEPPLPSLYQIFLDLAIEDAV